MNRIYERIACAALGMAIGNSVGINAFTIPAIKHSIIANAATEALDIKESRQREEGILAVLNAEQYQLDVLTKVIKGEK